jgi:anti-sigma regulatory factor (Ser/Thr protein kinase)
MGLAPDRGIGFVHEVLLYDGIVGFLAGTVPWIRAGLETGDAVAVLVGPGKLAALRDELGDDGREVRFVDLDDVGPNPARIIPVWRTFVDEQVERGRPLRGVGEPVCAGRSEAELRECELHEILLGPAFRDGPPWQLLCPYDVSALDPAAIELAQRSHPYVAEGLTARPSPHYRGDPSDPFAGRLPAPPPDARIVEFASGPYGSLRRFVAGQAAVAGLVGTRVDDAVLAVSELVANSYRHGSGTGTLRAWVDGRTLVCEVEDAGRPAWDPLVGRQCPPSDQLGGRGLWVVNQICDLVQMSTAADRTTVRLHISRE